MKPIAALITYVDPGDGEFYVLDFDIMSEEAHSASSTVSAHPVQEGVDISDYARPNLKRLSLKVRITDSPINAVTNAVSPGPVLGERAATSLITTTNKQTTTFQAFQGGTAVPGEEAVVSSTLAWSYLKMPELSRVKNAWTALRNLCDKATPVEVFSDLQNYPSMLITNVSAPRDGTTGLTFSLELVELRTAQKLKTFVTITKPPAPKQKRAIPLTPTGKKGKPREFQRPDSVASQAIDLLLRPPQSSAGG